MLEQERLLNWIDPDPLHPWMGEQRPGVRAPDPPLTFWKGKDHVLGSPVSHHAAFQHGLLSMEGEAREMVLKDGRAGQTETWLSLSGTWWPEDMG